MKKKMPIALLVVMILLTQFGFASAQKKAPPDTLTTDEMNSAIVIANPNARPLVVGANADVLYQVSGTSLYIKVSNLSRPDDKLTISPLALWSKAQVCGIHVYSHGLLVADLYNRANVTYYTSIARSPAKFNWYDMRGTKTNAVGFSWTSLGQTSSPSVGVKFNSSGWVQSHGALNGCLAGICGPQGYFVSYLNVKTSGTSCR